MFPYTAKNYYSLFRAQQVGVRHRSRYSYLEQPLIGLINKLHIPHLRDYDQIWAPVYNVIIRLI